jgi:hypothetical protein
MRSQTRAGMRCHTLRNIITAKGIVPRDTHGTIRGEVNNLGRYLVLVDWDSGLSVAVPPYELVVPRQETPSAKARHFVVTLPPPPLLQ